nr:FAD-binding oxidoreductase [Oceanospirillaceae bacterium]
ARNLGLYLPQLTVQASVAQTQPMDAFTEANSVDERLAIRRRADGGYSLALADSHRVYVGPDALRHARAYLPLLGKSWRHLRLASVSPKGFPDAWSTPRRWAADQLSPFEQNRVLEPKTDVGMEKLMLKRFQQRFPNISLPRIKDRWSGMIDTMPDVVPVVDRIAEVPGLIVATGMSGHGFGIGPGFGRVVARMVNERLAEHDLSRFRYNRFSDGSQLELGPSL